MSEVHYYCFCADFEKKSHRFILLSYINSNIVTNTKNFRRVFCTGTDWVSMSFVLWISR